jgi:3-phenylpropionate/trans-cinnamate dioxygenase ferredoxin subunit
MTDFIRVCRESDVPDPGQQIFEVDGRFIVVFHIDGAFYALDDCCTHDGGPLGEGRLEGFNIICPRHGARFDVRSGRALTMPAVSAAASHQVKVDGGDVLVKLSEG